MSRTSFTTGWSVGPNVSIFTEIIGGATSTVAVTLPHDAMLSLPRHEGAVSGASTGYFEGGSVTYRKEFEAPIEWTGRVIELQFDGVYRDAMVYLNGVLVGQRPHGYSPFRVRLDAALDHGAVNRLRVDARAHQDSRWYSGLGIHRDVWLHDLPVTHIVPDGVAVTTTDVDDERAAVDVAVEVANAGRASSTRTLSIGIRDSGGALVASGETPVTVRPGETAIARVRVYVDDPALWAPDDPALYELTTTLQGEAGLEQEESVKFGIRTLRLDPRHGLRINGVPTLLRGACIHHDNGVLGAVSIAAAEERRVRILKEAGFNAIRSSHNTISPAMLDACDRLGMLVIDEAFDMWTEGKQPFDYSLNFTEWWRRDIEAMVRKDRTHPSVIIYSIGNEILDAGKPLGAAIGRDIAEEVRRLDPARFLTNGISGVVATLTDTVPLIKAELAGIPGGINDAQGLGKAVMDRVARSEFVTSATAESHAVVDIAGHNYAAWLYEADSGRFPNRVVVGTESNPKDIAENWALVRRLPWVIGDFTWTGWDYLGESGLGAVSFPPEGGPWDADRYPSLLAFCGDIDITGFRRPASFYREIVFGLRSEPFIAVHRPRPEGRDAAALGWAWTDSVAEWSWQVAEGTPMIVDVYSDAEEVELTLDDEVIGRAPAGPDAAFTASFTVPYRAGRLSARNVRNGQAAESWHVESCGEVERLRIRVDSAGGQRGEHEFLIIELVDDRGAVVPFDDREVTVMVDGEVSLLGLGSARPDPEGSYVSASCTTYLGRALAVVRCGGTGDVTVATRGGLRDTIRLGGSAPS